MSENELVFFGGAELARQSDLYEPMLYYGSSPRITIDYVSDIHLLHHVKYYDNDIRKAVRAVARSLYQSRSVPRPFLASFLFPSVKADCLRVFLGDVSSDKDVTVAFFKQYRLNAMYQQYKRFKNSLVNEDEIAASARLHEEANRRRDRVVTRLAEKGAEAEQLKPDINKYVNYNRVIAPKGSFESIERYLASKYYKKRNLPHFVAEKILAVARLEDEIQILKESERRLCNSILAVERIEQQKATSLLDFKYESFGSLGLVVLGNHEYIGFRDVEEAVDFYRTALKPLGYIVLQNSYVESELAVIYGGSGFAKYSEQYNANNLLCCNKMMGNRKYEIEQTTLFEKGYEKAKQRAQETGKCFICVSHYPVESCLGRFDREAVYFTGHTHRNERIRTEGKVLYADNQVGYHKDGSFDGVIRFKSATTDSVKNPYGDFVDGCFDTTPDEYLQFCNYIGEYIGEGKLIRNRCKTGELCVIKSRGYYGFFVVNKNGISIVNGGRTKRIALNKNIKWIHDNFNIVVNKYLAALEPLRSTQVQISQELKRFGFDGTIHGLIVDIDFYNHIMVNPFDGTITFYYSPYFGQVQQFESFQKQLAFMGRADLLENKVTESQQNKITLCGSHMLAAVENNDVVNEMATVSRRTGAYEVSRAINPLQRLFTGHVLRDFDLRLVEVEDEKAVRRKVSLVGRVYMDKECCEYLVIYDDLGEFIRMLDVHGNESVMSVQRIRTSMTGNNLQWHAKWVTKSIETTVTVYSKDLPKSWRDAIRQMFPTLLETNR